MLQMYRNNNGMLEAVPVTDTLDVSSVVWVDLISPTPSERSYVVKHFHQPLFTLSELEEIESSARFYEDDLGLHVLSSFLCESRAEIAKSTTVGFIIQEDRIFSLREREISSFRLYLNRSKRHSLVKTCSPYEHLLNLLGTKTEQLADEIEFVYSELDALNRIILSREEEKFDLVLLRLANLEDSSSRIRTCLMDSQRALVSLGQRLRDVPSQGLKESPHLGLVNLQEASQDMLKNLESLMPHNEALFQRISFLMQTAMGLTEIEQNRTMKRISDISIATLLPNFVAAWLGTDLAQHLKTEGGVSWKVHFIFISVLTLATGILFQWLSKIRWNLKPQSNSKV